jgi:hypothetical protein
MKVKPSAAKHQAKECAFMTQELSAISHKDLLSGSLANGCASHGAHVIVLDSGSPILFKYGKYFARTQQQFRS